VVPLVVSNIRIVIISKVITSIVVVSCNLVFGKINYAMAQIRPLPFCFMKCLLSATTLSRITLGIMTFSITTLSITTFSIIVNKARH
jgi:hypothetical protein